MNNINFQSPKVLGIDPSLRATGFAVNKEGVIVETGILSSKKKDRERHVDFAKQFKTLLAKHPDLTAIAIESQYLGFNPSTAIKLSELKGILIGVFLGQTPDGVVLDIHPKTAKSAVGVGNLKRDESKIAVRKMVEYAFPLLKKKNLSEDEIDAVAISIAGFNSLRVSLLEKLGGIRVS